MMNKPEGMGKRVADAVSLQDDLRSARAQREQEAGAPLVARVGKFTVS